METILILLCVQGLLGAFDNIWHHELTETLSRRPEARNELILHSVREFTYALIFCSLALVTWHGLFAILLLAIMLLEIVVTLWDFVIEDKTRKLPPLERILHTVLAINFGIFLALLVPEVIHWYNLDTGFVAANYGILSWIMTIYGVGVFGWAIYDLFVIQRLAVPDWKRLPFRPGQATNSKTILITGATGFIGTALTRALVSRGDRVIVLSRSGKLAHYRFGPHVQIVTSLRDINSAENIDAFINLAGEPLLGWFWSKKQKQILLSSRIETTENLLELARHRNQTPALLINGSAIGYYGKRGDEDLTEEAEPQAVFMSDLCQQWEERAQTAKELGIRVCCIRIGLVFAATGGAFGRLALPIKLGLGAVFGSGKQWISWIHLDDLIAIFLHVLDNKEIHGPLNATAPNPVRNEVFTKQTARHCNKPTFLRVPAGILKRALGELADLFIAGQKVLPAKAIEYGFRFRYPTLADALPILLPNKSHLSAATGRQQYYYNSDCPICSHEINHCRMLCEQQDINVFFTDLRQAGDDLKDFGLGVEDLKRRVYLAGENNELIAGAEAIREMYLAIPQYRWIGRCLRNPVLFRLAEFLYESIVAPSLCSWANRRQLRKAKLDLTNT